MAALLAAALGQIGDRPARLAAILADRYRRTGVIIAAALVALAGASAVAAICGALIGPKLTPEARQLFVALALALQGGGMLVVAKAPERLDRWRLGAFGTSLAGLFILAFGDGVQFVVLALAARAGEPVFATIGATIGGLVPLVVAATLGEAGWLALPQAALRRGVGILFLLVAVWLALGALRLI
ncbi:MULTISPECIES: TMEM165/GDT1 family protein [unclassified Sphingomonas]|uniref:TMEM165/GDT1 family protein n=1 Tax=unclassified Sphingomonas TaxID=196159 RepID=UPI001E64AD55|nr:MULTISPECIES: TMEM165/GDT1 family protein [unclassified Sphingomonas]